MHLPHSSLSCLSCVDRHVEAIHETKGSTARALRICVSYHTKFNKWSRFAAPSPTCLGTEMVDCAETNNKWIVAGLLAMGTASPAFG